MKHSAGPRDHGAAAVEFALVAMMLITLLFGTIEFGRFWMIQSTLSQIAREGAREMAINGTTAVAVSAVEDAMRDRATDLHLDASVVLVTDASSDGTAGLCEAGKTAIATIEVQNVATMTGIDFWGSITLTGKAEMRCGG